eukprot:jgi/Ulvmu1/8973/UM005_0064.1
MPCDDTREYSPTWRKCASLSAQRCQKPHPPVLVQNSREFKIRCCRRPLLDAPVGERLWHFAARCSSGGPADRVGMKGAARNCPLALRILLAFTLLQAVVCEKILLLLSDEGLKSSHSAFIGSLQADWLTVEIKQISDPKLQLHSWGKWLYDGIVVLSKGPQEFGGAVDSALLVEFVDAGGNLFIAADESPSASTRDVASQLGAEFVEQGASVRDYVAFAHSMDPSHLLTTSVYPSQVMTGAPGGPIIYQGGALTTSPDSVLAMRALMPAPTAVVTSAGTQLTGSDFALAVTMQSRTDARFCIVASIAMLSDSSFKHKVAPAVAGGKSSKLSGNQCITSALLRWTMKQQGVLKYDNLRHHRVGEDTAPPANTYTVNDEILFSLDVLERDGNKWRPHVSNNLIAQFVMLDPYVRQPMKHDGQGAYSLAIQAPDVYGVFKWVVDYKAPGYTAMKFEEVTPVRPMRHDQYPRFILQAYPYYTTIATVSVGFLLTVSVLMFHQ